MLSNQTQALTRERQKLEAEAAKRKSHQSTMSKAVKNLVRQARDVVEQMHEVEMGERHGRRKQPRFRVRGSQRGRATAFLVVPKPLVFPRLMLWDGAGARGCCHFLRSIASRFVEG